MNESLCSLISQLAWIGSCYSLRHLSSGEYHDNHIIVSSKGSYVLRINRASQLQLMDQIYYEYRVLTAIAGSKRSPEPVAVCHMLPPYKRFCYLPTPRSYQEAPHPFLIETYIQGRNFDYQKDMHIAADTFARIHALPVHSPLICYKNPLASLKQEGETLLQESTLREYQILRKKLMRLSEAVEKDVHVFAAQEPYLASYVNTEVNSGNFIVKNKKAYLVDWEKAVISHPAIDIAHFLSPSTTRWKTSFRFSEKQRRVFYAAYREEGKDHIQDFEHLLPLFHRAVLFRALSWCYHASLQDAMGLRRLPHSDTREKISSYLTEMDTFIDEALYA